MPITLPLPTELATMSWDARNRATNAARRYVAAMGLEAAPRVVYVTRKDHARRRPLRDSDVRRCECGAWRVKGDDCATCAVLRVRGAA
jgi:hypothetical protein